MGTEGSMGLKGGRLINSRWKIKGWMGTKGWIVVLNLNGKWEDTEGWMETKGWM